MPTITDIMQQKRPSGRFCVYVDGTEAFRLSDLELSMSGLRVGQEIDAAQMVSYQKKGETDTAYNLALRQLSERQRSQFEIKTYLSRKGFSPNVVEDVLERLRLAQLVDDVKFAIAWISDRQSFKPRSRKRLQLELRAKGISAEDTEEALSGIEPTDELRSLEQVVTKKQRLAQYQDPAKLIAYLLRQGYPYDLVRKVIDQSRGL